MERYKEPWQMTRIDFYKAAGAPSLEKPFKFGDEEIVGFVRHPKYGILLDVIDVSRPGLHTKRISADELHKQTIRRALSEGKPVPAEVLKDYPDLARTAKATNPPVASDDVEESQFIRSLKKTEQGAPSATRHMSKIPDKPGWKKGYKPYGEQGRGYYYVRQAISKANPRNRGEVVMGKMSYIETPQVGDIVRTLFGPPWRTYVVDEVEISPEGVRFRGRQTTWRGIPYKNARSVWLAFKRPGTIAGTEVRYTIVEHRLKGTNRGNPVMTVAERKERWFHPGLRLGWVKDDRQEVRIAAVRRRLPLGQWLEQAIADRAKRDVKDELDKAAAEHERLRKRQKA